MQKKLLFGLVVTAVYFAGLFPGSSVILPPRKTITLVWEYPDPAPEILFNVYSSSDVSVPLIQWPLLATVKETSCTVVAPAGSRFYYVTASNIVTGLESAPR